MKQSLRRAVQLFVLLGLPALGFLYAYQFQGQSRELTVPFKPFKAPQNQLKVAANAWRDGALPLLPGVTLVNFWASWCPPCVEEFPAMLELQRQLEDKGLHILFVSVDDTWEAADKFLRDNGLKVKSERLFWDADKSVALAWGSVKFPESYVLRPDGWVVEKIIGAQQWTRPSVLRYFEELGEKYKSLSVASLLWRQIGIAEAHAEEAALPTLIHEDDKKALENLRKNIETASGNLAKAEAAVKQEERNLKEQEAVLKRRRDEQAEAEKEATKLQTKLRDVESQQRKQEGVQRAEENEKARVEAQIKGLEARIVQLQKQLEATKEELSQTNKTLNTRVQSLGTAQQALESLKEEVSGVSKRYQEADKLRQERLKASKEAETELASRKRKQGELEAERRKAMAVLDEQKRKLAEFEKALQR